MTASVLFFLGNTQVSQSVSYPLVSTGPAVITALWGVFYFKEIRGASPVAAAVRSPLTASLRAQAAEICLFSVSRSSRPLPGP